MARTTEVSKSKSGKRKRKPQQYVLSDVQQDVDESLEGGLDASHSSPIDLLDAHNSHLNEETMSVKNKRGPTKLKGLGMEQNMIKEIEYNERGQPIGDTSITFASFLGALVRSTVQINIKNWTLVSKQQKEDMWTVILQRYKLDEVNKKNTLQKMGNYLREYRSRISTKVRAACALEVEEAHLQLAKLKPQNLTDHEWKEFIKRACSATAKSKSDLMKFIRSHHKLPHTMSRRGYARLEQKMKKEDPSNIEISRVDLWSEGHKSKNPKQANASVVESLKKIQEIKESQSSTQISSSLRDDALSKVLGEDRPGRTVIGLGFGVTITKLNAQAHSSKIIHALEDKVNRLEDKLDKLIEQGEKRTGQERVQSPQVVSTPESHHASNTNNDLHEPIIGQKCKIMSWYKRGEIVAEGSIASIDPVSLVHCKPLGLDAWKVWIEVGLVPEAHLWRTTSDMTLVEHAIGVPIAWNKQYIILDP
ncbi:carboxypeptidase SOL1 [Iris pallida]|uniref:Carboxypeptidase SOL1 n=1 Tax=Iris pallida TaxID=29817 RepID=A0AAX6IM45_IRIPA|nr:carboxypeptidase SOL1 [Iris pallida]